MAMFKGFKPQGLQKIANSMGYTGSLEGFSSYLQQNPDKQNMMNMYNQRAVQMAQGGAVRKMQQGGMGAPTYVNPITPKKDPNNLMGPVGAAVMSYGYNPTTNQYSISGGGGQQFGEGFESSMDMNELYKKYPQLKGTFEKGRPQQPKTIQDMMVGKPVGQPMMTSPGFDPRYQGTVEQSFGQQNQIPVTQYEKPFGYEDIGYDLKKGQTLSDFIRETEAELDKIKKIPLQKRTRGQKALMQTHLPRVLAKARYDLQESNRMRKN